MSDITDVPKWFARVEKFRAAFPGVSWADVWASVDHSYLSPSSLAGAYHRRRKTIEQRCTKPDTTGRRRNRRGSPKTKLLPGEHVSTDDWPDWALQVISAIEADDRVMWREIQAKIDSSYTSAESLRQAYLDLLRPGRSKKRHRAGGNGNSVHRARIQIEAQRRMAEFRSGRKTKMLCSGCGADAPMDAGDDWQCPKCNTYSREAVCL
jgi:hypothetical protein